MLKVLALPALLVFLVLTSACASMSLEEYAEECGEWEDDYGYLSSSSSIADWQDALEDWDALSPPGEVKALHDIRTEGFRLYLKIAEENEAFEERLDDLQDELDDARRSERDDIRDDMDDLSDDQEDLLDDLWEQVEDLNDDYEDELDDLPRGVERDLEREDCI